MCMQPVSISGTNLKTFIEDWHAVQAELSPAHVAALRIYTTHLFKCASRFTTVLI